MVFIWLMSALFFILLEMAGPGLFYCLSLTVGSLLAACLAYLEVSSVAQISGFLLGASGAFWGISKLFKRAFTANVEPTNVYKLVGKRARVIRDIDPLKFGAVKCDGQDWLAQSSENIGVNQIIEITEIRGCHVVVKSLSSNNSKDQL